MIPEFVKDSINFLYFYKSNFLLILMGERRFFAQRSLKRNPPISTIREERIARRRVIARHPVRSSRDNLVVENKRIAISRMSNEVNSRRRENHGREEEFKQENAQLLSDILLHTYAYTHTHTCIHVNEILAS